MRSRRRAITVPPEVETMIRRAAEQADKTVSEWLTGAALARAEEERRHAEALVKQERLWAEALAAHAELMAEYEAELGPIPPAVKDNTRFLSEAGIIFSGDRPAVS